MATIKKFDLRTVLFAGLVVLMVGLLGCTSPGTTDVSNQMTEEKHAPRSTVPHEDITLHEAGEERAGTFEGLGPHEVKGYLVVRNKTGAPAKIKAKFTCKDSQGDAFSMLKDEAPAVAPDEVVMLCAPCYSDSVALMSYKVTCEKTESWATPLGESVSVEEVPAKDGTVGIKITNTRTDGQNVWIASVRMQGIDKDNSCQAGEAAGMGTIAPGESLETVFYSWSMFDPEAFSTWDDLERRYFVSGYASIY